MTKETKKAEPKAKETTFPLLMKKGDATKYANTAEIQEILKADGWV